MTTWEDHIILAVVFIPIIIVAIIYFQERR